MSGVAQTQQLAAPPRTWRALRLLLARLLRPHRPQLADVLEDVDFEGGRVVSLAFSLWQNLRAEGAARADATDDELREMYADASAWFHDFAIDALDYLIPLGEDVARIASVVEDELLALMGAIGARVGDDVACPGCGCEPGDGRTDGCAHPEGCGFYGAEVLS